MKEFIVRAFDNLDKTESEIDTPATKEDILIGWRGKWVTLDLTDAHFAEAEEFIGRYIAAGETPERTDLAPRKRQSYRIAPGAREFYKGMRDWADEVGRTYTTSTGKTYYNKQLRADYAKHLMVEDQNKQALRDVTYDGS